ncbi:dienelactone hydrolase family protein [Bernardetia sp. MNP-M8]|uniref:alpha/beta hydrolase family protein n=1 Tax=Bernardetia sp. MNP-M8 TaxID=3127470 RepID=UPI0030D53B73
MKKIEIKLPNPLAPAKSILIDYHLPEQRTNSQTPIIVFLHGFKGFKDWGAFNQMAQIWTQKGFLVFKVNFSHNGTTTENPLDFEDLEAFGQNTITKELSDTATAINFIYNKNSDLPKRNREDIRLVGHSRGGSTAIIYASKDKRIKKVITLSAVSNLEERYFNEKNKKEWHKNGVVIIENGRTNQKMPLFESLHEDFKKNPVNYSVKEATQKLNTANTPQLILHGAKDMSVTPQDAQDIFEWSQSTTSQNQNAKLILVEEADHTYNTKHPNLINNIEELPTSFLEMTNLVARFE